MEEKKSKSQKRIERQKRREERRKQRESIKNSVEQVQQPAPAKKRKSLPGFLAKHRKELEVWLWHYMNLFCKAENENIPYFKEMTREERNKAIQEYVDVSEFRTQLSEYLKEEELKRENKD